MAESNGGSGYYASDASIRARSSFSSLNGGWGYYTGANSLIDATDLEPSGNVSGDYNVLERTSSTTPATNNNIIR